MTSAFSFINSKRADKASESLSSSLVDELYDAKEFSSFVNQATSQNNYMLEKPQSPNNRGRGQLSNQAPISYPKKKESERSEKSKRSDWNSVQGKRNSLLSHIKTLYSSCNDLSHSTSISSGTPSLSRVIQTQLKISRERQFEISSVWQSLSKVVQEESDLSEGVVAVLREKKNAKEREWENYSRTMDSRDQSRIEKIGLRREDIHNQRSEIALDIEIWNKNDAELKEKMEEMVIEDTEKAKLLEEKQAQVQDEINKLLEKLNLLEEEKNGYQNQLYELEQSIQNTLEPLASQRAAHTQGSVTIRQRQKEIDEKSDVLDAEDLKLNREMKLHEEEKERALKEINELEKEIMIVSDKRIHGSEEGQEILKTLEKIIGYNKSLQSETDNIKRAKKELIDIISQVDSLESIEYEKEQKQMQLDCTVLQLSSKLRNLERQKQLAADMDQVEKLSFIVEQIKLTEKHLDTMKKEKESSSQSTNNITELVVKKEQLKVKKDEHKRFELETEKNISNIIENSYRELSDILNSSECMSWPTLTQLIEPELDFIRNLKGVLNTPKDSPMLYF